MTDNDLTTALSDALEVLRPLVTRLEQELIEIVYGGKKASTELINSLDLAIKIFSDLKQMVSESVELRIEEEKELEDRGDAIAIIQTIKTYTWDLELFSTRYSTDPDNALKTAYVDITEILTGLKAIREVIAVL